MILLLSRLRELSGCYASPVHVNILLLYTLEGWNTLARQGFNAMAMVAFLNFNVWPGFRNSGQASVTCRICPERKFKSRPPPPPPFLLSGRLRPQIHQHPQWTMFPSCRRTRSFTGRPDRAHDLRPHSFHGADLACCSAFRSRAKIWKPRPTCARNSGTGKGRSWTDELIGELPGPWTWDGRGISGA